MANSGLFPIVENIFSGSFELIFGEIVPLDSQEHNERKIKTSQGKVQIFSPYNVLSLNFLLRNDIVSQKNSSNPNDKRLNILKTDSVGTSKLFLAEYLRECMRKNPRSVVGGVRENIRVLLFGMI